jgi:hypothetical protein
MVEVFMILFKKKIYKCYIKNNLVHLYLQIEIKVKKKNILR